MPNTITAAIDKMNRSMCAVKERDLTKFNSYGTSICKDSIKEQIILIIGIIATMKHTGSNRIIRKESKNLGMITRKINAKMPADTMEEISEINRFDLNVDLISLFVNAESFNSLLYARS